ncbi:hypothetical protein MMC30_008422 [Trapelia coarctata]|nr:hypothetical protein [Trapelia coarctata]
MEGDTFGIAKEYHHLIDVGAPRQPSREVVGYSVFGSSGDHKSSGPSMEYEAKQRYYGFASQDSELLNKTPGPGTGNIRPSYAHTFTTNVDSDSQVRAIQAGALSCRACNPTAMEGSETDHSNSMSDPRRPTGCSSLKISHGRPAQPAKRLMLHSPKGSTEEEASSDFLPSASCQAGGEESTSVTDSGSASPAPTIPLPPLPRGHAARRSLFQRSISPSQEISGVSQIPRRRLGTPPLNSPRRNMHIGNASDEKAPTRTASKLAAHYKGQGIQQSQKALRRGAVVCEDPFEQRKIRTEKTQALKKRDLKHTRALQQGKERGEEESYRVASDLAEDTDDTIILPSITSAKRSPARPIDALARSSQLGDSGSWTFSTDKEAAITRRTSPVVALKQEHTPSYPNTRPQYCSHSTQYSPPKKASLRVPLSPTLSPTLPLFKGPATQKKSLLCTCCERSRQSKPNSTPTGPSATDAPDIDLENRLEIRLAAFERRAILLEAALLAVIDTSASFSASGVENRGDRWSGMSGRTEESAPLENKLEAMIAGINGFGR